MRVLIDTNVLISAALNAESAPFQAYVKAASYPNRGLIYEQNVDELKRIFNKKFPQRLAALDRFLSQAIEDARAEGTFTKSQQVRIKAVVPAEMYALLTGDKDFWESGIEHPMILTPAEFLSC